MTEAEWLAGARPVPMLLFIRERASGRKAVLFNCSCSRRVWDRLGEEDRRATAEFESNADDPVAIEKLDIQYSQPIQVISLRTALGGIAAWATVQSPSARPPDQTDLRTRLGARRGYGIGLLADAAANLAGGSTEVTEGNARLALDLAGNPRTRTEEQEQAKLVRDIFGNPFRPATLSADWLSSPVIILARRMYESRDFSAMPILADALQDAGCENADVLDHCRGPGPHVRGCWVVDLLLGNE